MHFWKFIISLIPGGILFAAAYALQFRIEASADVQSLLGFLPLFAAVVGLFLGWRFNRTRLIWVVLVLTVIERSLASATPYGREYVVMVAAILLPFTLLLIGWWSERGLLTLHGLCRFLIVAAQFGLAGWLFRHNAGDVMALLEQPVLSWAPLQIWSLSQVAALSVAFCLLGLLVRYAQRTDAIQGSFCWALVSVACGLSWPTQFAFWAGVAILVLTVALIESSFSMAFNDELTDLPARRAMNEFLLKVGRRYTIAMVDIDHFKKVNDTHGHDVGDQVLRMVATSLRRVTGGGRAYRYGGEEFAVIFAGKDLERALPHLEELRETIARAGFVLRGRKRPKNKPEKPRQSSGLKKLQVTASIGVAERDDRKTSPEQVIKAADQALYKAKKGGRNKVCH